MCVCWESDLGLRQEQRVLLTAEPPLQLQDWVSSFSRELDYSRDKIPKQFRQKVPWQVDSALYRALGSPLRAHFNAHLDTAGGNEQISRVILAHLCRIVSIVHDAGRLSTLCVTIS